MPTTTMIMTTTTYLLAIYHGTTWNGMARGDAMLIYIIW